MHLLQVMYHQHLQHRQGHAYFVPPAMCQQLLDVARRASRPPQQPARPHQAHTNAYLAVLESGLSTQKKPAKRPDEEMALEPPPLEEILGRDPEEIEPGELPIEPGELQASSNGGIAVDAGIAGAPPLPMQQEKPCNGVASASAEPAMDGSQQVSDAEDSVPYPQSLQSEGAKQSFDSAAHGHNLQPGKEAKASSRLLEKFDAARQEHSEGPGAVLATGGATAAGAKPVKPLILGGLHLPMLSPLVLSSAPNHTPMHHASSAPAAPDQGFSFGQATQLQSQPGGTVHPQQGQAAGEASSEMTPVQGAPA